MSIKKKSEKKTPHKEAAPDGVKRSKEKEYRKPKKLYSQLIFRDWCKACGICIEFCPKGVLVSDSRGEPVIENPENCIGCRFCELHCPDLAINIQEKGTAKET